jgi:hypothetical protein
MAESRLQPWREPLIGAVAGGLFAIFIILATYSSDPGSITTWEPNTSWVDLVVSTSVVVVAFALIG